MARLLRAARGIRLPVVKGPRVSVKRTRYQTAKAVATNLGKTTKRRAGSLRKKVRRVRKRATSMVRSGVRRAAGSRAGRATKYYSKYYSKKAVSKQTRTRVKRRARVAATKTRRYAKKNKRGIAVGAGATGGGYYVGTRRKKRRTKR